MANFNNNNSNSNDFSQQELDLARVYGLDNSANYRSQQDLENLTGYNFDNSRPSMNNMRQPMRSNERMMNNNQSWDNSMMQPLQSNQRMMNNGVSENRDNSSMEPNSEDVVNVNERRQRPSMSSEEAEDRMLENNASNGNNGNNGNSWNAEDELRMDRLSTLGQNQALEDEVRRLNNNGMEQRLPSTSDQSGMNMQMREQRTVQLPATGDVNSFLRTQLGRNVRIQFLIGNDTLVEKSGWLLGVGSNYIMLKESGSGDILLCDIDDIKFISLEDNR